MITQRVIQRAIQFQGIYMKALFFSLVSMSLIVSQTFSLAVFADTRAEITPEETLVTTIIASQGSMRTQEAQNSISAAIANYSETAPQANRLERLEKALVEMNVMTTARVQRIVQESDSAAEKSQDMQSLSADILNQVLSTGSPGAQFSSCATRVLVGSGLVIGAAGLYAVGQSQQSGTVDSLAIVTLLAGLVLIVTPDHC
jgi:hypothetical protein